MYFTKNKISAGDRRFILIIFNKNWYRVQQRRNEVSIVYNKGKHAIVVYLENVYYYSRMDLIILGWELTNNLNYDFSTT